MAGSKGEQSLETPEKKGLAGGEFTLDPIPQGLKPNSSKPPLSDLMVRPLTEEEVPQRKGESSIEQSVVRGRMRLIGSLRIDGRN